VSGRRWSRSVASPHARGSRSCSAGAPPPGERVGRKRRKQLATGEAGMFNRFLKGVAVCLNQVLRGRMRGDISRGRCAGSLLRRRALSAPELEGPVGNPGYEMPAVLSWLAWQPGDGFTLWGCRGKNPVPLAVLSTVTRGVSTLVRGIWMRYSGAESESSEHARGHLMGHLKEEGVTPDDVTPRKSW
jgi:hypothetical protein